MQGLLSLAKKKKPKEGDSPGRDESRKKPTFTSDSSDSEGEWDKSKTGAKKSSPARRTGKRTMTRSSSESEKDGPPDKAEEKKNSEPEEGELSDSEDGGGYSSDSSEEFNDGYDDQLMGDEEDRKRLAQMTEVEREQEIYKRIEQRELMKTRYVVR